MHQLLVNFCVGECGGKFRAPVVIKSPNYPLSYPHNMQTAPCDWTITVPPASRVQCNFTDFDTEEDYDVVSMCEGEACCLSSVVAEFSGTLLSAPHYTSTAPSLTIRMTSDGIVTRRGFSASCSPRASVTMPPTAPPPVITPPPVTAPPLTPPPGTTSPPTESPGTTPPHTEPPGTTSPLPTIPFTFSPPVTTDMDMITTGRVLYCCV